MSQRNVSTQKAVMSDNIKDVPIDIGLQQLNTNEVFFQSYYDLEEESKRLDVYDRDINNELGSTGAYEEYTASKEEETKIKVIYEGDKRNPVDDVETEGWPWFFDEPEVKLSNRRKVITLMVAGVLFVGLLTFLIL